jgi:hypothetical protein
MSKSKRSERESDRNDNRDDRENEREQETSEIPTVGHYTDKSFVIRGDREKWGKKLVVIGARFLKKDSLILSVFLVVNLKFYQRKKLKPMENFRQKFLVKQRNN